MVDKKDTTEKPHKPSLEELEDIFREQDDER